MEELHELRRYHDATPEPAPETIGAARSRLGAHMRGGRRPRARRIRPIWALTLAGAATAALVVAVAVVPGTGKDSPAPHAHTPTATELRLRPVANVQDVADNAALLADGEPEWAAEPTQWGYVKSLRARTRTDGGEWLRGRPAATNTHEQWRRLDDKAFATIEKGRLKVSKGSEFEVSYSYLLALPTDAGQLLARIYRPSTPRTPGIVPPSCAPPRNGRSGGARPRRRRSGWPRSHCPTSPPSTATGGRSR